MSSWGSTAIAFWQFTGWFGDGFGWFLDWWGSGLGTEQNTRTGTAARPDGREELEGPRSLPQASSAGSKRIVIYVIQVRCNFCNPSSGRMNKAIIHISGISHHQAVPSAKALYYFGFIQPNEANWLHFAIPTWQFLGNFEENLSIFGSII